MGPASVTSCSRARTAGSGTLPARDESRHTARHNSHEAPAHVADYLRAIADGLDAGDLRLSSGQRELHLHPRSLCTFELRASSEPRRVKLRLELGWRATEPANETRPLRISGK